MKTALKKAAAIAVAALSFSFASYVYASNIIKITYYSDASYSQAVGESIMNLCHGRGDTTTGTVTSFSRVTIIAPCGFVH
ncbi:hypothetical protein SG34_007275 [Thalassomonas viridans]|uniref:Uncharacterized protein n=1 Tax=Thalassomonas viridans TaxID=137584 RepID=A0AAE9Z7G4_9GAMM|nr:hypothetical protein [Thalassomonas viridans]WDE06698.1 hypothetical protein SG34_007275 [Thalassomonas viridans]